MKGSPKDQRKSVDKDNGDVIHQLEHYQQVSNWDCGIACVLMVLPTPSRNYFTKNFNQIVEEEKFGESTWTIDLAYLLNRFNMKFSYYTTTIGIDPGYCKENFYDKENLPNFHLIKDDYIHESESQTVGQTNIYTCRVSELNKISRIPIRFLAKHRGIHVEKLSVSMLDILENLDKGPVIVLTNAHQLFCSSCSNSISSTYSALSSCLRICSPAYQGHYVTLIGYTSDKSEVFYRNPTHKDKVCRIPVAKLDECRTAYGTDEDIIFIQYSNSFDRR